MRAVALCPRDIVIALIALSERRIERRCIKAADCDDATRIRTSSSSSSYGGRDRHRRYRGEFSETQQHRRKISDACFPRARKSTNPPAPEFRIGNDIMSRNGNESERRWLAKSAKSFCNPRHYFANGRRGRDLFGYIVFAKTYF